MTNPNNSPRALEEFAYSIPWAVRIALLPIVIVVVSTGAVIGWVKSQGDAETAVPAESVLPVEVLTVSQDLGPAMVAGTGTVSAAAQVTVIPEVPGRVVEVSARLAPGGRFQRGELLARIDGTNYVAGLRQAEQQLEVARLELALEEGRGEVAAREWAMLKESDRSGRNPDLALRHPQLAVAKAAVRTAEAMLDKARQDVNRTRLTAPFNAVIVSENVDVGQVVGAATQVAVLVGTDQARVTVSLPVEQLNVLDLPGVPRPDGSIPEVGSKATVSQALSDGSFIVREGTVVGVSGQLDAQTRTAQVTVEIPNAGTADEAQNTLLPGAFVSVEVHGRPIAQSFRLPRTALYNGDSVWLVGEDARLERRPVSVAWSFQDAVVLSSGLKAGDQVVVSALSNPLAGQRVEARASQDQG